MRAHLKYPLAIALLAAAPALTLVSPEAVSAEFMTQTQIEQAAKSGTLAADLAASLGQTPDAGRIESLGSLLDGLIAANPALAAQVAQALDAIAADLAKDQPQNAVSLAVLVEQIISDPAVINAAPEIAGAILIALHETLTLAERSAESKGLALSGLDSLKSSLETLASNEAILAAMPDLGQQIADSVELANATADLAGFTTAAGPSAAPNTAAGGVTAAVSNANAFASFSSGGGGGGGTLPVETLPSASPTTL
jgi:hypothetical protein